MLAGNMPALPDNPRNEFPHNYETGSREGEREHVARSSRHVVGLHDRACVDSDLRGRTLRTQMHDSASDRNEKLGVTRRRFLGISLASGAALLAGKSDVILGADTTTSSNMSTNPTFNLSGDFTVKRLGFGAMRITGQRSEERRVGKECRFRCSTY